MGLLKRIALSFRGVNAWATERSLQMGHYPQRSQLDITLANQP